MIKKNKKKNRGVKVSVAEVKHHDVKHHDVKHHDKHQLSKHEKVNDVKNIKDIKTNVSTSEKKM
jgi:hypothetical protein